LVLSIFSLKMMYGDPIDQPTHSVIEQVIKYADCSTGKYAHPFIKIQGDDTEFHVIKEFTYRTNCYKKDGNQLIVGKKSSFTYFTNSDMSAKVIEISVNGEHVYSTKEFVGKSTSSGALLFIFVVISAIFLLFSGKKLK